MRHEIIKKMIASAPARPAGSDIQDENAHLWAVSYTDFLMVLLCFFVLFFSVDGAKRDSVIDRITQVTGVAGNPFSGTGNGNGNSAAQGVSGNRFAERLKAAFAGTPVSVSTEQEKLTLVFSDNFYAKGALSFRSTTEQKAFDEVLEKIRPFMKDAHITFVGHTDATPVQKIRTTYLHDNFDLSSLRATRALQYAVHHGFAPEHMAAQGAASNVIGSRTLSLVIRPYQAIERNVAHE